MATAPIIEHAQSTSNSIVVAVAQTPAIVLTDNQKRDELFAHIQREIDAFEPDLSTAKGRDAIKSFAFKITRTKTAIDDAGKKLNEDARARINVVDAARKVAREKLDEMSKSVRKPLTDWEEAEKARIATIDGMIAEMKAHARVDSLDTAAMVRERGKHIWDLSFDPDLYQDRLAEAEQAKAETVETLKAALARLTKEEEDRAELERLRAAEAERVAKEQAEREEREAAERAAAEAKAEEERRAAAEKAEQERIEQVRKDAAEAAQREADEKAAAAERKRNYARQIIEHIKQVGLGMIGGQTYPYAILIRELTDKIAIDDQLGDMQEEVRAIRDATLANVQAAMERAQERAEQEAREEQERIAAAEQDKREASQKHRSAVMGAAKEAIMTCGVDEETAKKIVLLIRSGEVPNVKLEF